MSYTPGEVALQDAYLRYSRGAAVSLYETEDAAEPLFAGTVGDICELPDTELLARTGYIRYDAYIAFPATGNHRLRVCGARGAKIDFRYNELRPERYSPFAVFKENVFYKLEVGFSFKQGDAPSFSADCGYRLSVNYPSFGGAPSREIAPKAGSRSASRAAAS